MLGSFLSVFRGCDFPSVLTDHIAADLDTSPQHLAGFVTPAYSLNHTSIAPKHRHSFFPMDLMFERCLRWKPDNFLIEWPDVSVCTSRKVLLTPIVGLHSLLLRCPKLNLNHKALHNLVAMFFPESSNQDTTRANVHNLFCCFPPPHLVDTLLASPLLSGTPHIVWFSFLTLFNNFGEYFTPFEACSSLAKVFKMLIPFEWNEVRIDLNLLRGVGDKVVSLHWLSIPPRFDSPLLCHLPSLAGAQQGVLQTLSSHTGLPSLVTPRNQPNWNSIRKKLSGELTPSQGIHILSQIAILPQSHPLSCRLPALVSAAIEFIHRFVSVASDVVLIKLVLDGLLDIVKFAVSCSPFLNDYEKGVAVIGILLDTIRRDHLRRRMRGRAKLDVDVKRHEIRNRLFNRIQVGLISFNLSNWGGAGRERHKRKTGKFGRKRGTVNGVGGRWTRRKANIATVTRWRDTANLLHEHPSTLRVRCEHLLDRRCS
ncbi:hypothetical protein BLNAU_9076 [Blattamonas nauphoetae]|uniref:Uncharacterized protein n=1 Tax=Blattamonas nauphoetae TaxID=2049346 RepID=A0ABQ9XWR2_9EUKA|nr:hypothetical protein BLNAU_9076 [Blattamonas nauphoetae]